MTPDDERIRRVRKILRDEACLPIQYRNEDLASWFVAHAPAEFDSRIGLWRLPSIGASFIGRPASFIGRPTGFYRRAEKMFVETPEALAWRIEQVGSFDMGVWREMWRKKNSDVA